MKREKVCLIGGTGFVGSHLLNRLSADYDVVVLSRNPSARRNEWVLPNVRFQLADAYDVAQLKQHLTGASAVINLVGILNESDEDGVGFKQAHVTLLERLLEASGAAHTEPPRLLHVSALNAGQGDSFYLRSKGEGEELLRQQSRVPWTIFQPSVMFGPGDGFLNRFAGLLKLSPVLPQPCPQARFQPVYVGDVAEAIARCVADPSTIGKTYQLAGPRVYSMLEVIDYLRDLLAIKRGVIGLPDGVSRFIAMVCDWLPVNVKPFSKDNYQSLQVDSVATENGLAQLGIRATAMEAIAPKYIANQSKAQRYQRFRQQAGRG